MRFLSLSAVLYALLSTSCVLVQSSPSKTQLPPLLINVIPSCAAPCLEYFIVLNYPPGACANTQDIDCLCSTNSTTGFTIGEAALRCVVSACTSGITEENRRAYSVCIGVRGALPNTHSTITATLMAATTIPISSTLSTKTSLASNFLPPAVSNPSVTISGTSIDSATGTPFLSSLSSKSSTIVTAASSTIRPDPQMAPSSLPTPLPKSSTLGIPQIVGITVAGVASAAIVFGVLVFVYCIRRKRRLKRESQSLPFQIEKRPMRFERPPMPPEKETVGLNLGGGEVPAVNKIQTFQTPPSAQDNRRSFWRKSIKPEEIGVAVSPEITQESPASVASTRTASKLLPDKPSYSLFPAPLRISHQLARPMSTETEFEEDFGASGRTSMPTQTGYQELEYPPPQLLTRLDYPSSPSDSQSNTQRTDEQQYHHPGNVPFLGVNGMAPPTSFDSRQLPRLDTRDQTGRRPSSSTYSGAASIAPDESHEDIPLSIQNPSQITNHQRQSVLSSTASETSFEFDDEETPPERGNEQHRALSTVEESPIQQTGSPLSTLRYPKLPRPASLSKSAEIRPLPLRPNLMARSDFHETMEDNARQPRPRERQEVHLRNQLPSSSSRDDSPSSLLAKRRGDEAANIIERGLRIREDANAPKASRWRVINRELVKTPPTTQTYLNRGGREAYGEKDRSDRAADIYAEALKSPSWEPRITPTRRGNDLYLSVDPR